LSIFYVMMQRIGTIQQKSGRSKAITCLRL
jgi:hypothetical protein